VIDLYAITDDPAPPLPDVAELSAVASHGLAVVCAPAHENEKVTPEVLWRHEEVVEALMEDRDLLPVRFGTRVDDETAAARALGERHRELANALDRVRGAVELSLRMVGEPADDLDAESGALTGADYLQAKARAAAAHEEALRTVHRPLAREARENKLLPTRGPTELLRAAYLVDRARVDAFVDLVVCLQAANPESRLLCTGPWPPYSFTEP
jgi:hypothetical protein